MPDGGVGRSGLVSDGAPTPKIWVAANGPRSLRLTGTYADGWLPMGGISPAEYTRQRAVVSAAAAAAGRPDPVAAYFPLIILGHSRDSVAEIFERNPLSKMILLFAPASIWERYGLEHPSGPDCRGYPDTIPHALDPEATREALRQTPRAMLQEFVCTGSAEDIAEQLRPYREGGMQHVVLADLTGLVYDPATTQQLMAQYGRLRVLLQNEPAVA
jgi:phthiodiolone/phenolphthiodiolone dimycocerosates ketoreductase